MKMLLNHIFTKALLSLLVLSFILSACGQATRSGTSTPSKAGSGGILSAPGSGDLDSGDNAIITFAGDEWLRSTYEPLMEEFHELYPNITVKFAPLPETTADNQDVFRNIERTLAETGDTSITFSAGSPSAGQYFLDLAPLMEGDPAFDPADFWAGSLEACQDADGQALGIPTSIQITGIFYDEAAFAEAGMPAPRPGWTWDDFRKAAMATTKTTNGQLRYGYAEQSHNMILIPTIDGMITAAGGEIDTTQIQGEVQWYLDLVDAGAIFPPIYSEDPAAWEELWKEWQELFTSPQRPAMWVGQLSDSLPGAEWVNDEGNPFKNSAINIAGFAPFPVSHNEPNQKTSLASTQCLAVSKGTRNPRAAFTWINFLSQQWTGEGKNQMWDLMQIPARKSTVEANNYWDQLPEKAVPALKFALEHAWYQPGLYVFETSAVLNAVVKAAAGYGQLASLLAQAKEQIPEIISPTPDGTQVVVATVQPTISPDAEVVNYFANTSGKELAALTELADRYNDLHPDQVVKITTQLDVQGDWFPALAEQFDCFYWYNLDITSRQQDRLYPLDSYFESEGADFVSDYDPNLIKAYTVEGELYGLPVASDFQMMAYNKDLLLSKGVELPANDWTYDDFSRLLAQVGGGVGDDRVYGYQLDIWDESLFNFKDVIWADLEADPPVPMLNSQDMLLFVEWLVDLKDSGGIYLQTPENYMESDALFRSGRIAFFRTSASQPEGWYFVNEEPPFEIGVAPFPVFDDSSDGLFINNSRAYMISRKAQNPRACWDWITFLSAQPSAQLGVPARRSVLESSAWEAAVGKEHAAAMRAGMKNLRTLEETYSNFNPLTYPLTTWRNEAIRKALAGDEARLVLDAAQAKSVAYLECMKGIEFDQTNEETIRNFADKIQSCASQVDPEGASWRSGP